MPDSTVSPAPRRARRKDARPAEVIEAARALFIERGYAATKVEDVARRAGVSVGLPYLYFENKAGLFKAVVRATLLPQVALGEDMLRSYAGPTADLLRLVARSFLETMASPVGGIPKLVIAEAHAFPDIARFYAEEVVVRGRAFFAAILTRGIERGEFRPVDVPHTARILAAPLSMLCIWSHSLAPFDETTSTTPEGYIDAYLDVVLAGLAAPSPPPAPSPGLPSVGKTDPL